jgi:hypothetical protein
MTTPLDASANWGKCNICKKPIAFGAPYVKCTVSTCNRKRLQLIFCSYDCWDAHNPDFNHRDPGYTEHVAAAKA